jgi:uncharacterized protein YndB with AHSA1/START domain
MMEGLPMRERAGLDVATPADREIVMARVLAAPRDRVFEALTRPELLRRWLPVPQGWSMETCEDDPRAGGGYRWEWRGPEGKRMAMGGTYGEVTPPGRIARSGTLEAVPGAPPREMAATLVLVERRGKTSLHLTALFPSREARDAALALGMASGVAASCDRLEALLAAGRMR